jgi:hypothetical protein
MAAVHYSPLPATDRIEDPVSYKEASALLAPTGHPASPGTVARWFAQANQAASVGQGKPLTVVRVGKTDYVSWSDVLKEHARRTAVKLRASSNWP